MSGHTTVPLEEACLQDLQPQREQGHHHKEPTQILIQYDSQLVHMRMASRRSRLIITRMKVSAISTINTMTRHIPRHHVLEGLGPMNRKCQISMLCLSQLEPIDGECRLMITPHQVLVFREEIHLSSKTVSNSGSPSNLSWMLKLELNLKQRVLRRLVQYLLCRIILIHPRAILTMDTLLKTASTMVSNLSEVLHRRKGMGSSTSRRRKLLILHVLALQHPEPMGFHLVQ